MTITFFGDPFDLRGVYNPIYADNKGQEIKSSCPPLGDPFDLRGVYNPIYADNKGQEIKSSCPPLARWLLHHCEKILLLVGEFFHCRCIQGYEEK